MIETENGRLTLHENSYPKLYTSGDFSSQYYYCMDGKWYMQAVGIEDGTSWTDAYLSEGRWTPKPPWYKRLLNKVFG